MVFAQKSLCCYFGFGMPEWAGLIFLCSEIHSLSVSPYFKFRQIGKSGCGENASPQFPLPLTIAQGPTQHTANMFPGGSIKEFLVLRSSLWGESTEKSASHQGYLPGVQGSLGKKTRVAYGLLVIT